MQEPYQCINLTKKLVSLKTHLACETIPVAIVHSLQVFWSSSWHTLLHPEKKIIRCTGNYYYYNTATQAAWKDEMVRDHVKLGNKCCYRITFSWNFGNLTFANSPSCFISSGISGLSNVFVKFTSVWHTPYSRVPSLAWKAKSIFIAYN